MDDLKAIETIYHGCRFRSRLEARWAVFFDALDIDWSYETEGYNLPEGGRYLPDFKLYGFKGIWGEPDINVGSDFLWCEVKGVNDYEDMKGRKARDLNRILRFAYSGNPIIILPNSPSNCIDWWNRLITNLNTVWPSGKSMPCIITKLPFEDGFRLYGKNKPDSNAYIDSTNSALNEAKMKRFEFTEQDLEPLEHEVEVLQKRVELQNKKNELIKQLTGGN